MNLTATPGMTNVTLMWLEPEQPNGDVTYFYQIINNMSEVVLNGSTKELNVTVDGLMVFTNYTFNVTAMTNAGSSDLVTGNFTTLQGSML